MHAQGAIMAVVIFGLVMLGLNVWVQVVGALATDSIDLSAAAIDPPVITFALPVVAAGQVVSPKAVMLKLSSAGLSEVPTDRRIGPGNFQWSAPVLTLRPNFPGQPDVVKITFANNTIVSILSDNVGTTSVQLPPKPITSLSYSLEETDDDGIVLKSFPVFRVPARNGELTGSIPQMVLCSSEGGCGVAVDASGVIRAAWKSAKRWVISDGEGREGGSGICAQLIKNLSGDHSIAISRKLKEFAICNDLVRRVPPERMFESWANFVYFGEAKTGRRLLGLQTASQELFGVPAQNLDLNRSVFLAGLVSEPRLLRNLWKKQTDPSAWQKFNAKRKTIAETVARKNPKKFTSAEIEAAKTWQPLFAWDEAKQPNHGDRFNAPIIQLAAGENPIFRQKQDADSLDFDVAKLNHGIVAVTDIDESLNSAARTILLRNLSLLRRRFPPIDGRTKKATKDGLVGVIAAMDNSTGTLVTLGIAASDPTLEISALYARYKVFPASQSKTAVYGCAFDEKLITPTGFIDPGKAAITRTDGSVWQPKMGVGKRVITVTEAQASSNDGAAVVMTQLLGLEQTVECWKRFSGNSAVPNVSTSGEREFPAVCSLGFCAGMETSALQLVAGYSAIARNGIGIRPRILRGTYIGGKAIETSNDGGETQIFSKETAYIEAWTLRNVVGVGPFGQYGTAANLAFSKKHPEVSLACKTGSGPAALGITCVSPRITVTIQIFYAKNSFFNQTGGYAFAANTAGPALSDLLFEVLKSRPELLAGNFEVPFGVNIVRINPSVNCRDDANGVEIPFIRGTEPAPCPFEEKPTE
jgi:membrane peptidoglycan carboxypeptidase